MKRFLWVLAGLMVGMAHAQSVDWNAAYSGCTSEAREFDKVGADNYAPSLGRAPNWRDNRDYFAKELGTSATADALQRKLAEYRMRVDSTDYGRASGRLSVCGLTAALKQLQSGSTQSAATAPPRPSQSSSSVSGSGRDRPDLNASRCLALSNNQLRNNCGQKVSVNWCTDDYGTYGCGNNNLGWSVLDPGDSTYLSASKAWWFACAAPARPTEVEYLPGRGLRAACTQ